jgi:hypothetical protein
MAIVIPADTDIAAFSAADHRDEAIHVSSGEIPGLDPFTIHPSPISPGPGKEFNSASVTYFIQSDVSGNFVLGIEYAEQVARPCRIFWNIRGDAETTVLEPAFARPTTSFTDFRFLHVDIPVLGRGQRYTLRIGRTIVGGTEPSAAIPHIRSIGFARIEWPKTPRVSAGFKREESAEDWRTL